MYSYTELPDLAVVGTGIRKAHQMTKEAWGLVEEAEVVFCNQNDTLMVEVLANKIDAEIIDYSSVYDPFDMEKRFSTYFECMYAPLEEAKMRDGLVVYMGVGNPGIYAYTSSNIKRIGEEYWDLDIEMYAGVPASIEIYNMLNIDPADGGTQEITISSAVNDNLSLNDSMSYFGWLLGHATREVNSDEPLAAVRDYFSTQYDPDKVGYIVRASNTPLNTAAVQSVKLRNLSEVPEKQTYGTSLAIPAGEINPEPKMAGQFTEDEVSQLKSAKVRDERPLPESAQQQLPAVGKNDLADVLARLYTEYEFYIELREDPEDALAEYDITDQERSYITTQTHEKGGKSMNGYVRLDLLDKDT